MCYISLERGFHGESENVITLFARIEMYVWQLNEKSGPPKIFPKTTEKCQILSIFGHFQKRNVNFRNFKYNDIIQWIRGFYLMH